MSKFKSFASQGSFRDYQLQAPDESAKIREETQRTLRGKERAQQFLEGNNALYLQAQKLAQGLERDNREENFRLETENRQAFKDHLTQEYNIQSKAVQQRAAVQQKTLKDLSAFSKTAFELVGTIDNEITESQTKANVRRVYEAGADYKTVVAIQALHDGLTKAEFAQQDFIRDIIAKGGNLDAYFALYEARKTRGFITNTAVAQNTARAFPGFLNRRLLEFEEANQEATADERQIFIKTETSQWIANNFKGPDGRQLNPEFLNTVVLPSVREAELRALAQNDRNRAAERAAKLNNDATQVLNVIWDSGGGVEYIHAYHTLNPSQQKREILANWVVARLKAGTLSPDEARAILETPYKGPNGTDISWKNQFPDSKEVGVINEAIYDQRRVNVGETKLRQQEDEIETETRIQQQVDAFVVDGDGSLSKTELAVLEQMEQDGPVGFKSKALEIARGFTVTAQVTAQQRAEFQKRVDNGTFSMEYLQANKSNFKLYQEFEPIAKAQDKWRNGPEYAPNVNKLKALVANDPAGKVKAAPVTGDANWTVLSKQGEIEREYKKQLKKFDGDHDKAYATTLTLLQTEQSTPGAIDTNGYYTSVLTETSKKMGGAKEKLKDLEDSYKAANDVRFRTDPKYAAQVIGPVDFYNSQEALLQGKPVTEKFRVLAEVYGVSPLQLYNFAAPGAGQEPITFEDQQAESLKNVAPVTRRMYHVNRTNARVNRANQRTFGGDYSSSSVPKRASMVSTSKPGEDGLTRAPQGHIAYAAHKDLYINFGKFLQELGFKVGEHEAFGGVKPNVHSPYGFHPWNEGMDITDWRPGDWLGRTTRFKQEMRSLGLFKQVLGPGDAGHDTHVDLGGLMRVPTQEELDYLRSIFKLN